MNLRKSHLFVLAFPSYVLMDLLPVDKAAFAWTTTQNDAKDLWAVFAEYL